MSVLLVANRALDVSISTCERGNRLGDLQRLNSPSHVTDRVERDIEGPAEIVFRVLESEASVVVLDVDFGGQDFRALDAVDALRAGDYEIRQPAFVLVTSDTLTPSLREWASRQPNVYDVLRVDTWLGAGDKVAEAALLALSWHAVGLIDDRHLFEQQPSAKPSRKRAATEARS